MVVQLRNREDEMETLERMKDRIDRLMKAIQLEIRDGDLRVELIADLMTIRRKFDEKEENDERTDN